MHDTLPPSDTHDTEAPAADPYVTSYPNEEDSSTHERQMLPPDFHERPTPAAFPAASPSWPRSVWVVLWSDGSVESQHGEAECDDLLRWYTAQTPMKLDRKRTCYAVAKREVML